MTKHVKDLSRGALSLILWCGSYASLTAFSYAQQTQFVPLTDTSQTSGSTFGQLFTPGDLGGFVQKLFFFAITIGGFIAVGRLVYAGILYGSGDSLGGMSRARTIFRDTIIGLLLLLAIYLILQVINPQILDIRILDTIKNAPAQ